MKKIIYTRSDGMLCVIHPNINTYPKREEITEEEALERAKKDIPPDATNVQVVEPEVIPAERTFRNAWKYENGVIDHDIEKCREIHKGRLRALRRPKLQALDLEYMRADEDGDLIRKREIAERKQVLRDVTVDPDIANAQTPEELKAVIPECLK